MELYLVHQLIRRVEVIDSYEDVVVEFEQAITYEEMDKTITEDGIAVHRINKLLNGKGKLVVTYFIQVKERE